MDFTYYPNINDNDFYKHIVNKKEFYINRIQEKRETEDFYCNKQSGKFKLLPQQELLKNYISEDTPYLNLGIIHGTGVGKTNSAIAISENLQPMIEKYNSKIYILVPGQDSKNNFIQNGILGKITNNKYITDDERLEISQLENNSSQVAKEELRKILRRITQRYKKKGNYRIMGYEKFSNRVIGRKEKDKQTDLYKKDESGKIIREITGIKIDNIDNCVLIIDEAHNILNNNDYRKAVYEVMKKSVNARLILLTATPMFHEPTQIISFLELIRLPIHTDKIKIKDIFSKYDEENKDYELLPDGIDKIKQFSKGYISYLRGIDPLTFPNRIEIGEFIKPINVPKIEHLKYTKLIRCHMSPLQYKTYKNVYTGKNPKPIIYLSNMILPNPENDKVGLYKNDEIERIYSDSDNIKILKKKYDINVNYINENIIISGTFLKKKNLKNYSPKYYQLLENMNLAVGKKNGLIFIYIEDIRGVGLLMFSQILKENGYLQYINDKQKYNDDTIDITSGLTFKQHKANVQINTQYKPAKFMVISGSEDSKKRQKLINLFNSPENKNGNEIKIILGSKVTRESIDLKRIKQIHIVNAQWNFSTIEQIIGRGIRHCSHNGLIGENRNVYIFKYVASLPEKKYKESAEEKIYRETEKAHIIVKQIERGLKEGAIDCILNKKGNVFPEEIKEFKNCNNKNNKKLCDKKCDYMECDYNCDYEIPKDKDNYYKVLNLKELNKDTYTINFAKSEINNIIDIIKDIYKESHVQTIETIIEYINNNFSDKYIEKEYIYISLDKILNEKINIVDKYNINGYLIYRGNFYIFQPENKDETISFNERILPLYQKDLSDKKIDKYISLSIKNIKTSDNNKENEINIIKKIYDFLDKTNDEDLIAQYLSRQKIQIQENIIQEFIKYNLFNQNLNSNMKKIKKNYHDLLFMIDNTIQLSSTDINNDELNNNIIIGYLFNNQSKCFHKGKFMNCNKYLTESFKNKINKKKVYDENNIIIGFLDYNKGNVVFKLRPKKSNFQDKRKIEKGFICNQTSDKSKIIEIAKKLKIDIKKKKISNICNDIELTLRRNERNKEQNKKWFYDYIDIIEL